MHFDDRVVLALRNAEAFERSESAAIGGLDEQRAVGVGASEQRNRIRHQRVPAVDSQVRSAGLVEHAEHHLGRRLPVVLGHLPPEGQKTGAVLLWVCLAAPTDVWTNFRDQVQSYLSANSGQGAWWNWVVGGVAGAFSLIFQAIAVLVFPISYAIFSFFYSMYGAVLYVVGPLVLALYPALGAGQLARTFMVNLLVWNAWGIIYAIISQLLTIMSANSLNSIFTSQSFGGAFQGASQMLLISLSSILLSIMILLIPFIAKRVVSGDVGSTMLTVVGTVSYTHLTLPTKRIV